MSAGRSRPHILSLRDPQPPLLGRAPSQSLPPITTESLRHHHHRTLVLEERLASQHRDVHVLLSDNQQLAATHVALGQEVNLARHEVKVAMVTADKVTADLEREVRDNYERALIIEGDARVVERMRVELGQVRTDIRELEAVKADMAERLKAVREDLSRARIEVQKVPATLRQIENMHVEIQKGRAAIEYERKARAHNYELSQQMEKNTIAMGHEVQKLQAELANADKRAQAATAAATASAATNTGQGYAGSYVNPEVAYGGMQYASGYNMQPLQQQVQQVQPAVPNTGAQYAPASHVQYDMQGKLVSR